VAIINHHHSSLTIIKLDIRGMGLPASSIFELVIDQAYLMGDGPHRRGTIWLFNSLLWKMAHRNRWFTELKNGDFPWLC